MSASRIHQLANFVQQEFGVSRAEIVTALHHEESASHFPVILWQYGFITTRQLGRLFDWLEGVRFCPIDG